MTAKNTIYALASARGRAGVAVIRISGPEAFSAGAALAGRLPVPRCSRLATLRNPESGEILDQALVITFKTGSSFTAEDVVEMHTHGSAAVTAAVLGALSKQRGLRLAEPGEFTRRALENGNLDLAQVEGLADLLEAETEAQRKQAVRIMRGAVADKAMDWREKLIAAQALVAAGIDFSDEDIPGDLLPQVLVVVRGIRHQFAAEIQRGKQGESIRSGFEVALIGRPNIGKSTLLNAIAGRDVALTSEIEGTTRDVIELRLDLQGLPVTILDTAGLHETADGLDAMGVARAIDRADAADMRVFLLGPLEALSDIPVAYVEGDILAAGKSDLKPGVTGLPVSGKIGSGVDVLLTKIGDELSRRVGGDAVMIRERHRQGLGTAIGCLDRVANHIESGEGVEEFIAEDLGRCVRALDSLMGRVDVEDILDHVFRSFCLGK